MLNNNKNFIIQLYMKYLVTILTSCEIEFLKLSVESILEQMNYDNFEIYIVVNTLNELYFKQVLDYFSLNKHKKIVKIIRTESNGKPGKGHNSLLNIFKNTDKYEYLIILDGDDLLYPFALEKINNIHNKNNFDILTFSGSTKFTKTFNINKSNNNNQFDINIKYNFPEAVNITKIDKEFNNIIATPFRILCMNKKILKQYDKLYHEDMYCYDDYLCFLILYKLILEKNKDINILNISDPYLHLYNNININSVSNTKYLDKDLILVKELKKELNINQLFCEKINIIPYNVLINNKTINNIEIKQFYEKVMLRTLKINNKHYNNKNILFLDYSEWNYNTIQKKPLGGTESAIYFLSKELSKTQNVSVLTKINKLLKVNNKLVYNFNNYENIIKVNPDIIISQGLIDQNTINYKKENNNCQIVLWIQHDINVKFIKDNFNNYKNYVDKFIFVSHWQKNRFIQIFNLLNNKCFVIRNGISNKIKQINHIKKELTIVYISSPYRGLLVAYEMFQKIKKQVKNIKFKIFSSFSRDFKNNYKHNNYEPYNNINNFLELNKNEYDEYYKNLYELLIKDPQIEFYGSVPQNILFKHLETSMILFYPNTYPETCCTSILECMSYRCNIVTSDLGALSETCNGFGDLYNPMINVLDKTYDVKDAILKPIRIENLNKEYVNNMIDKCVYILQNYYSKYNQTKLDLQQEYIFNKCIWNSKLTKLKKIVNL